MVVLTRHRLETALFLIHGLATLAAGVVLVLWPAAIPATVGIVLAPDTFLLSYFLGAAEFAVAFLSIGALRLTDAAALRLIAAAFAVFHGGTAALELVHLAASGLSPVLAANVMIRLVFAAMFIAVWRRHRS